MGRKTKTIRIDRDIHTAMIRNTEERKKEALMKGHESLYIWYDGFKAGITSVSKNPPTTALGQAFLNVLKGDSNVGQDKKKEASW